MTQACNPADAPDYDNTIVGAVELSSQNGFWRRRRRASGVERHSHRTLKASFPQLMAQIDNLKARRQSRQAGQAREPDP